MTEHDPPSPEELENNEDVNVPAAPDEADVDHELSTGDGADD